MSALVSSSTPPSGNAGKTSPIAGQSSSSDTEKKANAVYITVKEEGGDFSKEFESKGEIGSGSYSTVYKVIDKNQKEYALKVSRHKGDKLPYCRIAKEASILGYLELGGKKTEGIIKSFGFGLVDGYRSLLLDLKGRTLYDLLIDEGALPVEKIQSIVRQLGSAFKYLKEKKVIHADVKPANVLFEGVDRVYLSDFGESFSQGKGEARTYTSIWYISPEGVVEAEHDLPADMWAVACLIFELATDRALFPVKARPDPLHEEIEYRGDLIPLHEGSTGSEYPRSLLNRASKRGKCLYDPSLIKEEGERKAQDSCASKAYPIYGEDRRLKDRIEGPFLRKNPGKEQELEHLVNLLGGSLALEPRARTTPEGMLAHPFLQEERS